MTSAVISITLVYLGIGTFWFVASRLEPPRLHRDLDGLAKRALDPLHGTDVVRDTDQPTSPFVPPPACNDAA